MKKTFLFFTVTIFLTFANLIMADDEKIDWLTSESDPPNIGLNMVLDSRVSYGDIVLWTSECTKTNNPSNIPFSAYGYNFSFSLDEFIQPAFMTESMASPSEIKTPGYFWRSDCDVSKDADPLGVVVRVEEKPDGNPSMFICFYNKKNQINSIPLGGTQEFFLNQKVYLPRIAVSDIIADKNGAKYRAVGVAYFVANKELTEGHYELKYYRVNKSGTTITQKKTIILNNSSVPPYKNNKIDVSKIGIDIDTVEPLEGCPFGYLAAAFATSPNKNSGKISVYHQLILTDSGNPVYLQGNPNYNPAKPNGPDNPKLISKEKIVHKESNTNPRYNPCIASVGPAQFIIAWEGIYKLTNGSSGNHIAARFYDVAQYPSIAPHTKGYLINNAGPYITKNGKKESEYISCEPVMAGDPETGTAFISWAKYKNINNVTIKGKIIEPTATGFKSIVNETKLNSASGKLVLTDSSSYNNTGVVTWIKYPGTGQNKSEAYIKKVEY